MDAPISQSGLFGEAVSAVCVQVFNDLFNWLISPNYQICITMTLFILQKKLFKYFLIIIMVNILVIPITLAGSLDIKFNMTLNDIYPALPKGSQTSGFVFIFISWSVYSIWHACLWEKVTVQKHLNHRRLRSFDLTPEREARNAHVIPVTVVFKGQETMLCPVHLSLSLRHHAHGPLAKRLMHMAHLSGKTSRVSKSSSDWLNYTEFPGDVCRVL